jgi:hypothetical protein
MVLNEVIKVYSQLTHARWVPSHHSMWRPQVADISDALQCWRVVADILTKQSRTADKAWPSSLEVSDRMSYIILRGRWCSIIVLNVHAQLKIKLMIRRQVL